MTILVTGRFDLDPSKRDTFVAAATAAMEASRTEAGCEGYAFSADLLDDGRFHVAEHWATEEAMAAHMSSAHLAAFIGSMGDFGITGVSLTKWAGATGSPLM